MTALLWLSEYPTLFPDIDDALTYPNGLLAAGGDLSEARLIAAYRQGIFPWFDDDQPILWWSPDPRCVLEPSNLKISKSLSRTIRKNQFQVSYNRAFKDVIRACAEPRDAESGTWITADLPQSYLDLHKAAYAV